MAADSVLNYDDIVDFRYNPFTNTLTPKLIGYGANPVERRTVPNSSPYQIKLFESPQENAPSTTRITLTVGGTELVEKSKTTVPGNLEYRVNYDELGNGIIEFNSAQAGVQMNIQYYGKGHLLQKISLDTRVPSTGNTTIAGIKTFSGNNIHNGTETFNNPIIPVGGVQSVDGTNLRTKVIQIGDWNMDTTAQKQVTHGLGISYENIRNIFVIIKDDIGTNRYPLTYFTDNPDPDLVSGGISFVSGASVNLWRRTGGGFDNNNFDSTSYNRGWVYLVYEV